MTPCVQWLCISWAPNEAFHVWDREVMWRSLGSLVNQGPCGGLRQAKSQRVGRAIYRRWGAAWAGSFQGLPYWGPQPQDARTQGCGHPE